MIKKEEIYYVTKRIVCLENCSENGKKCLEKDCDKICFFEESDEISKKVYEQIKGGFKMIDEKRLKEIDLKYAEILKEFPDSKNSAEKHAQAEKVILKLLHDEFKLYKILNEYEKLSLFQLWAVRENNEKEIILALESILFSIKNLIEHIEFFQMSSTFINFHLPQLQYIYTLT